MLQFLAPVIGQLIGQALTPKTTQPPAMGTGMSMGIPSTVPMAPSTQDSQWASMLGGILSMALGGGNMGMGGMGMGMGMPMGMGGMGMGMGGMGMGMGSPFGMGSMMGGLGGFFGGGMANPMAVAMGPNGQAYPQTMASLNQMVDTINSDGQSSFADSDITIADSAA